MNQEFETIPDELFDHERPTDKPLPERERFTPSNKNKLFIQDCRERGYDISTIINLALDCFSPKSQSNNYTWEGIDNVIKGKKKWY